MSKKEQYLMCVKGVRTDEDLVLAKAGTTYTFRDSTECANCGKKFVAVHEVMHPYEMECVEGNDWLPAAAFIPLNDPDTKIEDIDLEVQPPTVTLH